MELKYITRGNSSPKGKSRVYFASHPKDHVQFYNELADEILSYSNCAVYYKADPDAQITQEDLDATLRQMQLLIIPVTGRLLYHPNDARDIEIPYALKHHIPVLPLLQEERLEESFNTIFGDLQALSKKNQASGNISYSERVEKFLHSVLVKDDMAARIRSAFCSYIFLSYRQKDRTHAQKLMRIIHNDVSCWDVAIWYDEFLIPGENFNHGILDAIKKSELVTMVLTPNILTENNYVIECEYPNAVLMKKTILPVEMAPTSRNELCSCFPGIPDAIPAQDTEALTKALLSALPRTSDSERDAPAHRFYIGMAYLNAIDVETDHTRALSLIMGAAKAGFPEAVQKIVEMYRNGHGVKRDRREAIQWQEKLVEIRRSAYNHEKSFENGKALVSALEDLGNYWAESYCFPQAKSVYTTVHEYCREILSSGMDVRQSIASNYMRLGEISVETAKVNEAKQYFQQALEIMNDLAKETGSSEHIRILSAAYTNLGDLFQAKGELDKAKEYYRSSFNLLRPSPEKPETVQLRRNRAFACINLGDIARKICDLSEAERYYAEAMEQLQTLSAETRSVQDAYNLANCKGKLGEVEQARSNWEKAKNFYLESLNMSKRLLKENESIQSRCHLADCYMALGGLYVNIGPLSQARQYYLQALSLYETLADETNEAGELRDLSICCQKMGNVSLAQGNLKDAKKYYIRFLELCLAVTPKSDNFSARIEVAVCCHLLILIIKIVFPFVYIYDMLSGLGKR